MSAVGSSIPKSLISDGIYELPRNYMFMMHTEIVWVESADWTNILVVLWYCNPKTINKSSPSEVFNLAGYIWMKLLNSPVIYWTFPGYWTNQISFFDSQGAYSLIIVYLSGINPYFLALSRLLYILFEHTSFGNEIRFWRNISFLQPISVGKLTSVSRWNSRICLATTYWRLYKDLLLAYILHFSQCSNP